MVISFGFDVGGGLLGVALVSPAGSRKLAIIGIASGILVIFAVMMIAVFISFQAMGPGAQLMSYATLSYPTWLRGVGVDFNQAVQRAFSIVPLVAFPVLATAMASNVFWVISIATLLGTFAIALIKWDPTGQNVDAGDNFEVAPA